MGTRRQSVDSSRLSVDTSYRMSGDYARGAELSERASFESMQARPLLAPLCQCSTCAAGPPGSPSSPSWLFFLYWRCTCGPCVCWSRRFLPGCVPVQTWHSDCVWASASGLPVFAFWAITVVMSESPVMAKCVFVRR